MVVELCRLDVGSGVPWFKVGTSGVPFGASTPNIEHECKEKITLLWYNILWEENAQVRMGILHKCGDRDIPDSVTSIIRQPTLACRIVQFR